MSEIIASTYEVIEKIGAGGGGVVYLANHLRLGKKVVLKADKRKITTRPEILRREVDVLKNLSHTYIPQVYDFFAEGETVYTVMDYIEGESLDRPLKRGEKFEQPRVIKWCIQLLEALCYLHSPTHGDPPRGIVHSDIKPANIMRTPLDDICLIDFNIALALGEENVVGRSEGYSSPEHYGLDFSFSSNYTSSSETDISKTVAIDGDETLPMTEPERSVTSSKRIIIPDARSDIYSIGATLYHLLSGKKPNKDALQVIPLSEKEYSPQLVSIITRAMNPNPDLRYQTAEEMLFAVTHLKENDSRTKRLKRVSIAAAAVFALLIAGGSLCAFTGLKRMQAEQTSLTLAGYSSDALRAGDTAGAVGYALQALSADKGLFAVPYTAPAQKALAAALGVYDVSDGYKTHAVAELPSETIKTAISPDGKTGAAVSAFEVSVFDTETGKIMASLPAVKSALADVEFLSSSVVVYAGENGVCAYDVLQNQTLWTGNIATEISVSADGSRIAAVFKDEDRAFLYSSSGELIKEISFGGKKQRVPENDTFANPQDSIFALSSDGGQLAVSFEDGALEIYDMNTHDNDIEIYDCSDYTHFEGGFYGKYLAFSSTKNGESVFAVIDTEEMAQTGGFSSEHKFGVQADESGIYVSNQDVLVKIHPVTGEQTEFAYTDADVRRFAANSTGSAVISENNEYLFYDGGANEISRSGGVLSSCDFVNIAGDYVLIGGMDTPKIKILKRRTYENADMMRYDSKYVHDEARISADGRGIMLFNYSSFRVYDSSGELVNETAIPDNDKVYDQQYSKKSGNLAVMYKDALRIYSGITGELLFEETGLKSVFYAPYGVSILSEDGELRLIDIDSAEGVVTEKAQGDFAAYCGRVVDDTMIKGGKLIGAAKTENGYVFAVSRGNTADIYNEAGKKLFDVPVLENSEVFFTENAAVMSPLHGTPMVYSLKTGKKIADLEQDSYLTYITQTDSGIISEYISADGTRYALMLDKNTFEPIALMPDFCDLQGNEAIFDCRTGILRKTRIYSINELINLAKEGKF